MDSHACPVLKPPRGVGRASDGDCVESLRHGSVGAVTHLTSPDGIFKRTASVGHDMADSNGLGDEGPSADQTQAARELLESVIDAVSPGATVPFRSTAFGPSGGSLGFSYRNGSVMVEYQVDVDAADSRPNTAAATGDLVELDDHTPLSDAGPEWTTVERSAIGLIADTVTGAPDESALEPVTVWPVTNEPGLYRVGYEIPNREYLYAVAFKIPPSALG